MTDITPLIPEGRKVIKSYGNGAFVISGEEHSGSVIILPEAVVPWSVTRMEALSIDAFSEILKRKKDIEVLLLGTGPSLVFPPHSLIRELRAQGVVTEVMDTGAACRTYNVLLSEERLVAAAILAV